jgi:PadR family transcriptional regulator, regulatory protein PadR
MILSDLAGGWLYGRSRSPSGMTDKKGKNKSDSGSFASLGMTRAWRDCLPLLLTFYRECVVFVQTVDRRDGMGSNQTNLLQGTLDLLVLKALALGELHGLGISRRIEQITRGTFQVKPGSLFPALHRMEEAGWLKAFWGESENNRKAKYYRLTKAGERQLGAETEEWTKIVTAMASALKAV